MDDLLAECAHGGGKKRLRLPDVLCMLMHAESLRIICLWSFICASCAIILYILRATLMCTLSVRFFIIYEKSVCV